MFSQGQTLKPQHTLMENAIHTTAAGQIIIFTLVKMILCPTTTLRMLHYPIIVPHSAFPSFPDRYLKTQKNFARDPPTG